MFIKIGTTYYNTEHITKIAIGTFELNKGHQVEIVTISGDYSFYWLSQRDVNTILEELNIED